MIGRTACWLLLALSACGGETGSGTRARPTRPLVCTTLYPVHYFAERLAGDLVQLDCVVPHGVDPLHWRPALGDVPHLQNADLILFNGANAEPWAFSLALPTTRLVESASGFAASFITHRGITHSHGAGGPHTHLGINPHTWLDPLNASAQAHAVETALERILPDETATLRANLRMLDADLGRLQQSLTALGAQPKGEVLLASHAAYDYLARRQGWRLRSVDLDPTTPPRPEQMRDLRRLLGQDVARITLWETEPVQEWKDALARDLDSTAVVFSPCETIPDAGEPDYVASMQANVRRLAAVWR